PMRRVGNIAVLNVAFSPDGTRLATAGGVTGAGEATVWDAKTGKALLELKAPAGPARCVAFSADGTRVVTGQDGQPGGVTVWDARTGKALLELTGHRHGITSVAFSPDGTRLVAAGHDQTVKVWDAKKEGPPLLDLRGVASGESTVAFSPDGTRIVSGRSDGTATVLDARTGMVLLELKAPVPGAEEVTTSRSGALSGSFSPDGTRLLTAGGANRQGTNRVGA